MNVQFFLRYSSLIKTVKKACRFAIQIDNCFMKFVVSGTPIVPYGLVGVQMKNITEIRYL